MRIGWWVAALIPVAVVSCAPAPPLADTDPWHLAVRHTAEGEVVEGSVSDLISVVRKGCELRVAWGTRRRADSTRTIEHVSTPLWVAVRDGSVVEVQLDDFLINLAVLGEPAEEHPAREPYGGTDQAVMWRANLKTDGTFDAIWYNPVTGELINRVPQRHPMAWYANCAPGEVPPLFPN